MEGYLREDYVIVKKIDYNDTPNIHTLVKKGINVYVVKHLTKDYRFLFFSKKSFNISERILKEFLDVSEKINFSEECFIYSEKIVVRTLFYLYPYIEIAENIKDKPFKNKYKVHTSRIMIFNQKNIGKLFPKIKRVPQYILKKCLNKAVVDKSIKKLFITELFRLPPELMYLTPHALVLTQGGTGKSSVLGLAGHNLDNSSDAGIFGYYDTKNARYVSGAVNITKKTIIIDEINELIEKGCKVLDTLNKPLEQGVYSSGKAGGLSVKFGNQFILLGNISAEFHLGNVLQGLANNVLTLGRRFGIVVYDLDLPFKNGKLRPQTFNLKYEVFLETFSKWFLEWLQKYKLLRLFETPPSQVNKIFKTYKKKLLKILTNIENEEIQHFGREFVKAFKTRSLMSALEMYFYENYWKFYTNEGDWVWLQPNKIDFMPEIYVLYGEILEINITSFKILEEVYKLYENTNLNYNTENKYKKYYDNLTPRLKSLINLVIEVYKNNEINKNIMRSINYSSLMKKIKSSKFGIDKERVRKLKYKLSKNYNLWGRYNLTLNNIGLKLKPFKNNNKDFNIVIVNMVLFARVLQLVNDKQSLKKRKVKGIEVLDLTGEDL